MNFFVFKIKNMPNLYKLQEALMWIHGAEEVCLVRDSSLARRGKILGEAIGIDGYKLPL